MLYENKAIEKKTQEINFMLGHIFLPSMGELVKPHLWELPF